MPGIIYVGIVWSMNVYYVIPQYIETVFALVKVPFISKALFKWLSPAKIANWHLPKNYCTSLLCCTIILKSDAKCQVVI